MMIVFGPLATACTAHLAALLLSSSPHPVCFPRVIGVHPSHSMLGLLGTRVATARLHHTTGPGKARFT